MKKNDVNTKVIENKDKKEKLNIENNIEKIKKSIDNFLKTYFLDIIHSKSLFNFINSNL